MNTEYTGKKIAELRKAKGLTQKDLADWYGEGDNWGKSIRLFENWFWYEASF